jgi:hypothetical protein
MPRGDPTVIDLDNLRLLTHGFIGAMVLIMVLVVSAQWLSELGRRCYFEWRRFLVMRRIAFGIWLEGRRARRVRRRLRRDVLNTYRSPFWGKA